MTSTHSAPTSTTASASLRSTMQLIADALRAPLGPEPDAGLSLIIDGMPSTVVPAGADRFAAVFQLAEADRVPSRALVAALTEAANWGLVDASRRLVVVERWLALVWCSPPLPENQLIPELDETIATALALAQLVA